LIEHDSYTSCFVLTCDKCGRLDSVSTARTETQARRIAATVFGWEVDTPLGDLCRTCAGQWRAGVLGREEE